MLEQERFFFMSWLKKELRFFLPLHQKQSPDKTELLFSQS